MMINLNICPINLNKEILSWSVTSDFFLEYVISELFIDLPCNPSETPGQREIDGVGLGEIHDARKANTRW